MAPVHVTGRFAAGEKIPLPDGIPASGGSGAIGPALDFPPADSGFGDALAAAEHADVIIFVGGISAQLEGEEMPVDYDGFAEGDRTRIELPAVQEKLLKRLQATGKPVVFVNLSGSAVALPWEDAHSDAIVQAWSRVQAAGTAVADVLLGAYDPAGRLPEQ